VNRNGNRIFITIGLMTGLALASSASAAVCPSNTWNFGTVVAQCGTTTSMSFTQGGQTITVYAVQVQTADGSLTSGHNSTPNGLFEVDGQSPNLAAGIGPLDPNHGNTNFTDQPGIAEGVDGTSHDNLLEIEYAGGTGAGAIQSGTILKLLLEQGDVHDQFNVWEGVFNSPGGALLSPKALGGVGGLTEDANYIGKDVGALSNGVTVPQISITTTAGANQVGFIAIQADCTYLLLNSMTSTPPGHTTTPEPRFIGLLLVGMLAIPAIRRRFAPQQ
jgi:hypothetical protein